MDEYLYENKIENIRSLEREVGGSNLRLGFNCGKIRSDRVGC